MHKIVLAKAIIKLTVFMRCLCSAGSRCQEGTAIFSFGTGPWHDATNTYNDQTPSRGLRGSSLDHRLRVSTGLDNLVGIIIARPASNESKSNITVAGNGSFGTPSPSNDPRSSPRTTSASNPSPLPQRNQPSKAFPILRMPAHHAIANAATAVNHSMNMYF